MNDLLVARSADANVLLPEPAMFINTTPATGSTDVPVLPMIAVLGPALILNKIEDDLGPRCGPDRIVTSSKTMSPLYDGHQAGGLTVPNGSCSTCSNSITRSTKTKSI